mmetsp:Transcript_26308/g.52728  ORF Transcript_26308/g.52728 Transcript_26308/m.52728 type:complete len:205 (-) Transcript_26308:539-1153(-)
MSAMSTQHERQQQHGFFLLIASMHTYAMYAAHWSGAKIGFAGWGGRFGSLSLAGPALKPMEAGMERPLARGITWRVSWTRHWKFLSKSYPTLRKSLLVLQPGPPGWHSLYQRKGYFVPSSSTSTLPSFSGLRSTISISSGDGFPMLRCMQSRKSSPSGRKPSAMAWGARTPRKSTLWTMRRRMKSLVGKVGSGDGYFMPLNLRR